LNSQLADAESRAHKINVYGNLGYVYILKPVSSNNLILTGIEKYRSPPDGIHQKAHLRNQFGENVVVEHDVFAGAAAFDIFHEIRQGVVRAAD